MKVYRQKQSKPQQQASHNLTRSSAKSLAVSHVGHQPMHLQRTIGNQAVLSLLHANAKAVEVGSDTSSRDGQLSLAHELTHVVQQDGARTGGSPSGTAGLRVQSRTPGLTGVVQRKGRGDRGAEEGREEGRETRTERAQDDDQRRGRSKGGRDRRRSDPTSSFESDWAGRSILERYLSGEGDWDIADSPRWTDYMKGSDLLREQLQGKVIAEAQQIAAIGIDGDFAVKKTFHAELENGEGIVGYQYLHGTNKDVGDFTISGSAEVEHVYGHTIIETQEPIETGTTIHMVLRYVWNDKIDPNPGYGTDLVKSMFAELITLGEAESYRISIGWGDECIVRVPETGTPTITGYPGK